MNAKTADPDTPDESDTLPIPPTLAQKYEKWADILAALKDWSKGLYGRVSIVATVIGLLTTFYVFGPEAKMVFLWTLAIVIVALVATAIFIGRRREQLAPWPVEGGQDDDLLALYRQIGALYSGEVVSVVGYTTPLAEIQDAAWEWHLGIVETLDNLVGSGNLEIDRDVSVFGFAFARLTSMSKAAPFFVPKPIIPPSWKPWIRAAGYEADGD